MEPLPRRNENAYRNFFIQFLAGIDRMCGPDQNDETQMQKMQTKAYDYAICLLKETYRTTALKICFAGQEKNCLMSQTELREQGFFPPHYFVESCLVPTAVIPYSGEAIPVCNCSLVSEGWEETGVLEAYDSVKRHGFHGGEEIETTYFPELEMCYVTRGFNYAAMASLLQTGTIKPTYSCCLSQFFPYVTTDGESWIDLQTGRKYAKAYDYRIATAYELLRRKYAPETQERGCL